MAKANHHHMGVGAQGKGTGTGAMTDVPVDKIPSAGVLSNRDKSRHSEERGLDSKQVLNEQLLDHTANQLDDGKV